MTSVSEKSERCDADASLVECRVNNAKQRSNTSEDVSGKMWNSGKAEKKEFFKASMQV
jgi:hypothetical protein